MKNKILALLDKKLKDLEVKVTKVCEPPLTGAIYNLEGWLAEAELLEQLKREIAEL
jgi:hypothetical protein